MIFVTIIQADPNHLPGARADNTILVPGSLRHLRKSEFKNQLRADSFLWHHLSRNCAVSVKMGRGILTIKGTAHMHSVTD